MNRVVPNAVCAPLAFDGAITFSPNASGQTFPPKNPAASAPKTTAGNGTRPTASAINAAAAMPHATGVFRALRPTLSTAASTIASTTAFSP